MDAKESVNYHQIFQTGLMGSLVLVVPTRLLEESCSSSPSGRSSPLIACPLCCRSSRGPPTTRTIPRRLRTTRTRRSEPTTSPPGTPTSSRSTREPCSNSSSRRTTLTSRYLALVALSFYSGSGFVVMALGSYFNHCQEARSPCK